jgi:hypothetical protein
MDFFGIFPRHQNLCSRSCLHCESCTHRHGVTKARESLGYSDAEPYIALALIELCGFSSGIAKGGKCWPSGCNQAIFTSGESKFGRSWTQYKATIEITSDKTVVLKCYSKTVGGRASDTSDGNKLCEGVGT